MAGAVAVSAQTWSIAKLIPRDGVSPSPDLGERINGLAPSSLNHDTTLTASHSQAQRLCATPPQCRQAVLGVAERQRKAPIIALAQPWPAGTNLGLPSDTLHPTSRLWLGELDGSEERA